MASGTPSAKSNLGKSILGKKLKTLDADREQTTSQLSVGNLSGVSGGGKRKKKKNKNKDNESHGSRAKDGGNLSAGRSGKLKLQKLINEEKKLEKEGEKRLGIDHYDEEYHNTGNSHCLQAYMDFRA